MLAYHLRRTGRWASAGLHFVTEVSRGGWLAKTILSVLETSPPGRVFKEIVKNDIVARRGAVFGPADSTLRGHWPPKVDTLDTVLATSASNSALQCIRSMVGRGEMISYSPRVEDKASERSVLPGQRRHESGSERDVQNRLERAESMVAWTWV